MGADFCCFARLPSHSGVDIIRSRAECGWFRRTCSWECHRHCSQGTRMDLTHNQSTCEENILHWSLSLLITWGLSSRSGPGNIRQDWVGLSGLGGQLGWGWCRRREKHRLKQPNGQMPPRTAQCSCQSRLVRQGCQHWPSRSQSSRPGMSPHCQKDLPP